MSNSAPTMCERDFLSLGPDGFHRVAYTQWGNPHNKRVVICVHGLTRNGRDFDGLGSSLCDEFRIACVDLVGRGRSEWLADPSNYGMQVYMSDMAAFIARLGGRDVYWVGTSLGGLLGMMLAAQRETPIKGLVMNDVGPFAAKESLDRIGAYVGRDPRFADLEEAERYLREVHCPFGPLTDEQWGHLVRHSTLQEADGSLRLHYDPGIAEPFRQGFSEDLDLWPVWDQVRCPVLVVRGKESDILSHETAVEMLNRGPKCDLVEFPGIGHAPVFFDQTLIDPVRNWLRELG